MLNSYHTAFYICGATTTLSSCLLFLIPWLMPNQQGGVFRRDSCQSRIESLLSSQPSTPRSRQLSRFFHEALVKSSSGESGDGSSSATGDNSLCEADRIEMEYLKGFAANCDIDDGVEKLFSASNSLSMDTSINTVINSTMSHRGSITKFLLQQQLQSQSRTSTPVSGSRRGSVQSAKGIRSGGSSPMSSVRSHSSGSSRTSVSSFNLKASFSSKSSQSSSRRASIELPGESSSNEPSEVNSCELNHELQQSSTDLLSSRRDSGESTVVGSRWQSGRSTVVMGTPKMTPKISRAGDSALFHSVKNTDMLHLLAARLLQATRQREEDADVEERESVV